MTFDPRFHVECASCSMLAPKTGPGQLYCRPCSRERDTERKRKWAAANPAPRTDADRAKAARRREARRELGHQRKGDASGAWMADPWPDLAWVVRFRLPFSYRLSKNAVWSMAKGGTHIYLRGKARAARDAVCARLKSEIDSRKIAPVESKVYVDIFVQKPNHKGDAVNVVDSVCDGIKDALGVDDRWFSLRGVDWEIQRTDPGIWIGVGQASTEHQRVCSTCGRIATLDQYTKRKADKLGAGRRCAVCRKARVEAMK